MTKGEGRGAFAGFPGEMPAPMRTLNLFSGKHLTRVARFLYVMKFSPDLVSRVCHALDRMGYCFLSADEIKRLLAPVPEVQQMRQRALLEFAEICGAEVETTPNLKSARFVPAGRLGSDRSCPFGPDFQTAMELP